MDSGVRPGGATSDSMKLGGAVPLDVIPAARRAQVGPDAPPPMRLMAAKALLPMEPGELAAVLAYLAGVDDEKLGEAARKSATEVPESLLGSALETPTLDLRVLDFYGRMFIGDARYVQRILVNPGTADETVAFLAGKLKDPGLLDIIAQNQLRFLRHPAIIEALYYNPETRMSAISRVIESAVRNNVRLTHIPGYKEIEESILGGSRDSAAAEEAADEVEEQDIVDDGSEPSSKGEIDDDSFRELLRVSVATPAGDAAEDSEAPQPLNRALHGIIAEMSVAQKVRLGLMGNESARRILVRDAKRLVALSVLRSPKLNHKEITFFAQQRAVHEDVIREIARNREWTRYYPTMMALVTNPKCPPQQALTFVKMLQPKDLKWLSKAKDVPGFVSRNARAILEIRDRSKG